MGYVYIALTILFTAYGQIIIKWRIAFYGALPEMFSEKIIFLLKLLFDPFIFSGFVAAFISSLFWMASMTKFEVSYVYPIIVSGLLLFTTFFSVIFLGELVYLKKIIGILLILLGVFVMYSNN